MESRVDVLYELFANFDPISQKNQLNLLVTKKGSSVTEPFTLRAFVYCCLNFWGDNAARMMSHVIRAFFCFFQIGLDNVFFCTAL